MKNLTAGNTWKKFNWNRFDWLTVKGVKSCDEISKSPKNETLKKNC